MKLTEINIYPIKSLGGIALENSELDMRGLQFDRRWMLVDEKNRFQTQREMPEMAQFRLEIRPPFLEIYHKDRPSERLKTPLAPDWRSLEKAIVTTWGWTGAARICTAGATDFFSENLKNKFRLAFMPSSTRRQTDLKFAEKGQFTSFADAFSFLVIGQKSLDDLNRRLFEKGSPALPMNRFRPNFVFDGDGAVPFSEDSWVDFSIGKSSFRVGKPCARCEMTTIDQQNSSRGKEPLRTFSTYRFKDNKILFGQNLLWTGGEKAVQLGDGLAVKSFREPILKFTRPMAK